MGEILKRTAGKEGVSALMQPPEINVSGSIPTAAEQAKSAGLSKLTVGLRAKSFDFANKLEETLGSQAKARAQVLDDIVGDDLLRKSYVAARSEAADPFYKAAGAQRNYIFPDKNLESLLDRPVVKTALKSADIAGKNRGESIFTTIPSMPGKKVIKAEGLINIRKAIDDKIDYGKAHGWGKYEMDSLKKARADFDDYLSDAVLGYREANDIWAKKSAPINQIDIATALRDKLQPALNDFGGTGETGAGFARSLSRTGDKLAQNETGIGNMTLEKAMGPEIMGRLQGLGRDLARKQTFQRQMTGPGSNTASNLATADFLRNVFGPLGLPQGWAEATLPQTIIGPLKAIYDTSAEPAIQNLLGDALIDPMVRLKLLQEAGRRGQEGLLGKTGYFALPGTAVGISLSK